MKTIVAAAVMAACVLVSAAGGAPAARDPWKQLRRPLHLPTLSTGEPCPVSTARSRGGLGVALGDEPPFALSVPRATMELVRARARDDGWYAYRTVWLAPAGFRERVLVRGRRLDRSRAVAFASAVKARARSELRLAYGRSKRQQTRTAYTLVRSPGCFGLQADSPASSGVLVLGAVLGG